MSGVPRPRPGPSPSAPWPLSFLSASHSCRRGDVVARGLFRGNRTCCSPAQNPSAAAHCLLGAVRGISKWNANPAVGGFTEQEARELSPESRADVYKAVCWGRWSWGRGRGGGGERQALPGIMVHKSLEVSSSNVW